MIAQHTNWAGNVAFRAARWHEPETVAQVQELVRHSTKVKVVGSRHSFNAIADTTGDLLSLAHLERVLVFDRERHTVTVDGGVTYGEIAPLIHAEGYALHNMASLPHITVAGACATATHGSGDGNRNLASAVAAMEIVTADGAVVDVSRAAHGAQFAGMVVGLGGLGVVTKLTLDLVPTFAVRQAVYENLPLAQLEAHFEAIMSHAYSVSLFTDWQHERVNQVWVKHRVAEGADTDMVPTLFGATLARTDERPPDSIFAAVGTPQGGSTGPWYTRLPHFRADLPPGTGEELQSEYFVPRTHAVAALSAIHGLRDRIAPLLKTSEVRTIAADDLWMSMCDGRDSVALHFTWQPDWAGVREVLPQIETALAPFDPAPHWGKLFTLPARQVQAHYAKLPDFRLLLHDHDPAGKFRNAFLDSYIFGAD